MVNGKEAVASDASSPRLHTLYGAPVSLYTGKVRSYLRKQAIDFVEISPGESRYDEVIADDTAGLQSLLDLRTRRRVERVDHLEIWDPVVTDA